MKKNNKGFFLAETIIMIALVTTVIAFLYPNVSKLYENYNNRVKYYDQTEDLYFLRAVYGYLTENSEQQIIGTRSCPNKEDNEDIVKCNNTLAEVENADFCVEEGNCKNELKELYVVGYMADPTPKNAQDADFNKYLHRLKKTNYEPNAYRLIGVFEEEIDEKTVKRYASIKIAETDVTINEQ